MADESTPLIRKLSRVGDSSCVILDKHLLKMVDLEPDSRIIAAR